MSAIPLPLIAPLQAALQSQGFPNGTIRSDGTLNAAGLLAGIYDEVEFRSNATPNIVMKTSALLTESKPNPFLTWLRPTVMLRGRGGETVIAPVGVANGGSILPLTLAALLLVGLGYAVARATA